MKEQYTKILNAEPENPTISLLANLLSGKDGELSSIMLYFFQEVMTSDMELKKVLAQIKHDEMVHAKLLADAIVDFGGVPYLCNSQNKFFTTEYVDYALNEKQFLLVDILNEELAIKNYQQAIDQVENESLKTLLTEIQDDEKQHLKLLKEQLEKFWYLT